jgi:hypothetical protein
MEVNNEFQSEIIPFDKGTFIILFNDEEAKVSLESAPDENGAPVFYVWDNGGFVYILDSYGTALKEYIKRSFKNKNKNNANCTSVNTISD